MLSMSKRTRMVCRAPWQASTTLERSDLTVLSNREYRLPSRAKNRAKGVLFGDTSIWVIDCEKHHYRAQSMSPSGRDREVVFTDLR